MRGAADHLIKTLKTNQGTKFGTLKKPMLSVFDVIIFWFNGKINWNKIFRARIPVNNIWNNCFTRIIAPFCAKKEIIAPGYYSRKYGRRFIVPLNILNVPEACDVAKLRELYLNWEAYVNLMAWIFVDHERISCFDWILHIIPESMGVHQRL